MAETDVERLIIELQASNVALSKSLAVIARDVDKRLLTIEKRTETMSRRVTSAFNTAGRQFSRLGTTIFGGAALVGISRFVSRVAEAAGKIQDTADALGVSTDSLQAWGVMAGRAGVNQDTFNTALDRFAKNLGEAQLKGGEFAKLLNGIGVGTQGTVEEVFLRLADAVQATGNQQQKVAITTAALGRSAANLVPILQQGSAAIRTQTQELVRNGSVMTRENIAKIDELGDKWADLKRQLQATGGNVLGGFTDEFGKFAEQLSSPEFQESLKNFGAVMAQVAVAVAKAAPFLPNIAGAIAGARVGRVLGTPGSIGGAVLGGFAPEMFEAQTQKVEELEAELQNLKSTLASLPEEAQVFTEAQINSLERQIEAARALREQAARAANIPFAAPGTPAAATGAGVDRTGTLTTDTGKTVAEREAAIAIDTAREVAEAVADIREKQFEEDQDFRRRQFEEGRALRDQTAIDVRSLHEQELEDLKQFHADAKAAWDRYYEGVAETSQEQSDFERTIDQQRLGYAADFFGSLSQIHASASEEMKAITKAAALAEAIILGYLAVQRALAEIPPPLNIPAAIAAGTAAAVQVANIAAMEHGGRVRAGTPYIVGEKRAELFIPDTPGRIIPRIPPGMAANSQSMSNVFHIDARGAQQGVAEQIEARLDAWQSRVFRDVNRQLPDMMTRARNRKL